MKESPYRDWNLQQRLARMLQDEDFRQHCHRLRQQSRDFDETFVMVEKIAKIDISHIQYDRGLIHNQHLFTSDQILTEVGKFYHKLDELCPDGFSMNERFEENRKFFTTTPSKKGDFRSYCASSVSPEGEIFKEIYVNDEGRIGDPQNAMHEFGHSMGACFMQLTSAKDPRIAEIPTVIIDHLSSEFMMDEHPELMPNLLENDKFRQVLNVRKARECLADALVVKVMTGEISLEDAMDKYGPLLEPYPYILDECLTRLETFEFNNIMFEQKYLIPQAVALEMRDRFRENPQEVIEQLKTIMEHEHDWTQEQALEYLGLNKDSVIDDYVGKFDERVETLNNQLQTEKDIDIDDEIVRTKNNN